MVTAFVITGAPAVIIILLILVILVLGAVSLVRLTARGAKKIVKSEDATDTSG